MRILLLSALLCASCFAQTFGTWRVNTGRSTFAGDTRPKSFTVRIEPHAKGELFTFDRVEADGRTTVSSTILYLDEKPRDFQDFGCSGTQSSRRLDSRTVEILRKCESGSSIRLVRRSAAQQQELVLDITEEASGRAGASSGVWYWKNVLIRRNLWNLIAIKRLGSFSS
jgi:hypothetical protein